MQGIREYLLGVVAAAILCAIVSQMAGNGSFLGAAMKLITGMFMLLALASPMMDIKIMPIRMFSDISAQAEEITSSSTESTRDSVSGIIKERTQAYILDKAKNYGVELNVEVMLSDGDIPVPVCVTLSGKVSPYTKKMLTQTIESELGIGTEAQIWN